MRKFVASVAALVLAAFVTLFGVVAPVQASPAVSITPSDPYLYTTTTENIYQPMTFTASGFQGSVSYTISPSLPAGISIDPSTGRIAGTPTSPTAQADYTVTASGSDGANNRTATATVHISVSEKLTPTLSPATLPANTLLATNLTVSFGKGQLFNGTDGHVSFNFQNLTLARANSLCSDVQLNAAGAVCTANVQNSLTSVDFYPVNFSTQNSFTLTFASGMFTTPASGFAAINISESNGTTPQISANTAAIFSYFQQGGGSNGSNNSGSNGSSGSSGSAGSIADFTLPSGIGQPVAGQTVGIAASNLALNTNYSVVLRSTPQILEQGTTTATFMNTTVTIPAGLEPGWHSITFSAVRSDGVSTEQVAYFKISESGILLSTSTEVPAELAFTAAPKGDQWSLGVLLAVIGIGLVAAVYTYRRRVFEMVYVLTGTGSNFDIELVEQPKKARYLPMRKL